MHLFTFIYSLVYTMCSFSMSLEASVKVGGDEANILETEAFGSNFLITSSEGCVFSSKTLFFWKFLRISI